MHLLATQPGVIIDGSEAVSLDQSPGDIVILSGADTELAALAKARADSLADFQDPFPSLRLANFLELQHNLSVDLYVEDTIAKARFVCLRITGGRGYWSYGIDELYAVCKRHSIPLVIVPGDDKRDPDYEGLSSVAADVYQRLWLYFRYGGQKNLQSLLSYIADLISTDSNRYPWREPVPVPMAGLYWPDLRTATFSDIEAYWKKNSPVAPIIFYRAVALAAATDSIDALIAACLARDLNPLPIFVQSLKNDDVEGIVSDYLDRADIKVILNTTGFAVSTPGDQRRSSILERPGAPILQVIFAGTTADVWNTNIYGLPARDIAMNVSLPEVDGRIITRAVAFKQERSFDDSTERSIVVHQPVADRIDFVADLAAAWCRLAMTPKHDRRVAVVMANYPNRDGRLGNGVGLDTPASVMMLFQALKHDGYALENIPADTDALMARLTAGPTNARKKIDGLNSGVLFALDDYKRYFNSLPATVQDAINEQWGDPEQDPFVTRHGAGKVFVLPIHRFGSVVLAVQPARGYNIDPESTYHDPALVPPHGYVAFYAWLRLVFEMHAVVHMGKHGNLEWLPGKSVAMSENCFPEVVLGPIPHLYPFIVNDPGEGTQAKRRSSAVIIDHLTPPLTRAETYGPLRDLEALVDEYYDAVGQDQRRIPLLRREILDLATRIGLDKDCGFPDNGAEDEALAVLDNYLCELKELQIRDGLHIFGKSPTGRQETDLLIALTRIPRGLGQADDASLLRALAQDLGLSAFDPLTDHLGEVWNGSRPAVLHPLSMDSWRTIGDTVERLEILAAMLVSGETVADPEWHHTGVVLANIETRFKPMLRQCGGEELTGLLIGLDGRFVLPGPSGAPTRGRPEVLPTGRNFYSVDSRSVPTSTAWTLGWKSAQLLVDDYRQRHGNWPRHMAISAWGTSNMRTGGDDIAQALALIGVKPTWDQAARRVTGFDILPIAVLGRPRVDITFRISGFFRDAFPVQIQLLDSAMRAVMQLNEPGADNPLAERFLLDKAAAQHQGLSLDDADRQAGSRIFGSKPGAYGAGLQALIDEGVWTTADDLANAYLLWGSYIYDAGLKGEGGRAIFETQLARVDAVIQNQDNREHDLLDSDDYYQFQGGLVAAVTKIKGATPTIYHNDHSRPETPRVRTLADELGRVVRARAANPKWIAGVMRHGYKGAFEMAATVDYLFAYAATTSVVQDHHFDQLFDAYIADQTVRDFMKAVNPDALREISERFIEAIDRRLWKPRRNITRELLEGLLEKETNHDRV